LPQHPLWHPLSTLVFDQGRALVTPFMLRRLLARQSAVALRYLGDRL